MRPGRSAALALASLAALAGCGDAYSSHLPPTKASVPLVLMPDNARVGDTFDLHVVIFTPEELNYVTRYDFGAGIDVLYFDTGAGLGCPEVDPTGLAAPPATYPFSLCLTIVTQPDATLGERQVAIDVESGGSPLVARGSFWLLPAYEY